MDKQNMKAAKKLLELVLWIMNLQKLFSRSFLISNLTEVEHSLRRLKREIKLMIRLKDGKMMAS